MDTTEYLLQPQTVVKVHYGSLPGPLQGLLAGQLGNAAKQAVFWYALTPLMLALLDSSSVVGVGRVAFNAGLLASPYALYLSQRVMARKMLLGSVIARMLIWAVVIPLLWLLFVSGVVHGSDDKDFTRPLLYAGLMIALYLDGAATAHAAVVDVDFAGQDLIARDYGLSAKLTDNVRDYMNSSFEMSMSMSFVIIAPLMAYVGVAVHNAASHSSHFETREKALQSLSLVAVMGGSFFVFSLWSLVWFLFKVPTEKCQAPSPASPEDVNASFDERSPTLQDITGSPPVASPTSSRTGSGFGSDLEEGKRRPQRQRMRTISRQFLKDPPPVPTVEVKELDEGSGCCGGIWQPAIEGFKIVRKHPPVVWRLVLCGLEMAIEDAIILVTVAQVGIYSEWLGNGNDVWGNVWAAWMVVCGKMGGMLAAYWYRHAAPSDLASEKEKKKWYTKVFRIIFAGSLSTLLIPGGYTLASHVGGSSEVIGTVMIFAGLFFFFLFSSFAKVGLQTLTQKIIVEAAGPAKAELVFGWLPLTAFIMDAAIITIQSLIFQYINLRDGLWITCGMYLMHGLVEMLVGPMLILESKKTEPHTEAAESPSSPASPGVNSPLLQ